MNVMPGESRVLVDVRTIPGQDHTRIREKLIALANGAKQKVEKDYTAYDQELGHDRNRDIDIQVEFLTDRPCTKTDENDPVVGAADWATRKVLCAEPVYAGVPGATDGTFLWALKGIPIVTMGAGDREVPHQVDEWVDLDQLAKTADIYALAALHYLYPATPQT